MPLFGHKNKNHGTNTKATDGVGRQDFANTQDTNNLDNGAQNDPNNFNNTSGGSPGNNQFGGHGVGQGQGVAHAPVGSAALREEGMRRDREAQNFHAQSEELAEAERLEQAAREHRERAVAQGAHPHNKFLGGNTALQGNPTSGTQSQATY